ncbi:GIY-YIG nuclease family protein [Pseudalkalibacillus berkeleyi]|uniref:GIY-YIG nuclease family protein n=1 Tax=Pseudalkalibacillus berkeleyi TaxID=1069813 RepID=A0ABS9H6J0_9BACL|nr:GIY-YIG nuclease family protein [Pseudalkalibacillus berkeleyi]MCF6139574.1 GIY-YIG nuclease family protein [Pseudalkalibacillus berkeleyi]
MDDKTHCVYILECCDGSLYTGYTNDIEKRLQTHQQGKGAKYTRGRTPVRLVYIEEHISKSDALKAEYQIKQLKRVEKERLIDTKESMDHVEPIKLSSCQ